jgi:hypothetical protein
MLMTLTPSRAEPGETTTTLPALPRPLVAVPIASTAEKNHRTGEPRYAVSIGRGADVARQTL